MCGRFAATTDPARLAVQIDAVDETGPVGVRPPNYNVAPTTDIAVVVARHDQADDAAAATRRIRLMRWGLLPPWAKAGPDGAPQAKGPQLINARAETVTTSPAYRTAAKFKRCLIPMDGYYEWKPGPGRKTPFYFYRPDGEPLLVAGLWSVWRPPPGGQERSDSGDGSGGQERSDSGDGPSGQERSDSGNGPRGPESAALMTCTVITTEAVGEFAAVHDRMPLSLARADWDPWLDPDAPAPAYLLSRPPDVGCLAIREISTLVNNVANNGPELIEPADNGDQPVGLF